MGETPQGRAFTDADEALLYDVLNPWDPDHRSDDGFYHPLVMAADSVLDVGCGTGSLLRLARARGHGGRFAGLDPDRAALERARGESPGPDGRIAWVEGVAADAARLCGTGFDLATMTGHAFQCLVTDEEVRDTLGAVHAALRAGGRFVFETRHPQARAWEKWNPADSDVRVDLPGVDGAPARPLRCWHELAAVREPPTGGGVVVDFRSTTATPDGTVLRLGSSRLRFLDPGTLNDFLDGAGFVIEGQYGDWARGPLAPTSTEIITIARK
ncbi:class I SAM-dependent methyltransferase [Streptomyces sp. NBC_00237]|uniref:class I SAM-dependent methyltransferase n=1 Tax=Streptomyces sp. NBC_00237 TaxID=2975687 RepID=UPI002259B053|nr:class I SAM-dependent methyltransferase [Streptomyces sp. NBC_00237]MCX5205160.1 class I SAM-dependent methyltransferase [Streptomyces sp. NBC_00237]